MYSDGAPCAYFQEGRCVSHLTKHSWAVHEAAMLVAGRLLGAPRVLGRGCLERALRVAAVYHDLGKAAVSFQGEGRSFRLHEHVGALILWVAADEASKRGHTGLARVLMVAAGAVARHHAAMPGRHPVEVAESTGDIKAIAGLAREVPPGTPGLLAGGSIPVLLEGALARIRRGLSYQEARGIVERVKDMRHYESDLLTDTIMVAGALIVADILVSSVERNTQVTKSYARSWMRELGISMGTLQQITRHPSKPTLD